MRQLKITKQITGKDSFSIEKYLHEISKFEALTPEDEVELTKKIKAGDDEAKDYLVKCNLRFVVSVAKQYQNYDLTLEDLINEGNLGLIKAAGYFDETKGFKFISYAVWWIRQSILQAIAENARLVRLPLNRISGITRIYKCFFRLEQEYQREPTAEEIAEMMKITPEEVRESFKIAGKPLSMDAPLAVGEETVNMYDIFIPSDSSLPDAVKEMEVASLKTEVDRSLSVLPEREALVLRLYYGLGGYQVMSLDEIGASLGLSSERVRQVKAKAIRKLKSTYRNKRLKYFL